MGIVEPVGLADFLVAVIAGALVVLFGALYAATLAFGRLYRKPVLLAGAYACFALLALSLFRLAAALHLDGIWRILLGLLLLGYLLAPRWIWRLADATHGIHGDDLIDTASGGQKP